MDYSADKFLTSSVGREFVAGGFGGTTGFISSYPFDTLRIIQQQSKKGSAFKILRNVIAKEGPTALYRGMAVPFTSVAFQVIFSLPLIVCFCQYYIASELKYEITKKYRVELEVKKNTPLIKSLL